MTEHTQTADAAPKLDSGTVISDCPDVYGRLAIYTTTVVASLLLLIAHHGISNDWLLFESQRMLCIWYSETIVVSLVVCFVIRGSKEVFPWLAAVGTAAVVAALASHTGGAYVPDQQLNGSAIFFPYGMSLACSTILLLPFVQLLRDGRTRFSYARLYQLCWDNVLTLVTAAAFAGMAWLILRLCSALFSIIGLNFLDALFDEIIFIYPVTGLLMGFGIALGRGQIGAMRSALNVCLAIARPLLPMIGLVALTFLAALAARDLQLLWDTRHATSLLLWLILGVITLVNGVYQDGKGSAIYPAKLQFAVNLALVSLPIYAAIAAYALALRVSQYGWSVDRLYAAVVTGALCLYALAYGGAALSNLLRGGKWLALLSKFNPALALILGACLLAGQSAALDFRQISLNSQLARLDAAKTAIAEFDWRYLRHDLGLPGLRALEKLKSSPRAQSDVDFAAAVDSALRAELDTPRASGNAVLDDYQAGHIRHWPQSSAVPVEMLLAIQSALHSTRQMIVPPSCPDPSTDCVLIEIELNAAPPSEWVFVDLLAPWNAMPLFGMVDNTWRHVGDMQQIDGVFDTPLSEALHLNQVSAEIAPYQNLKLGTTQFRFQSR